MGVGQPRPDGDAAPRSHPGEPGIGLDLPPPFAAPDPDTRWLFALNRFGIRPGLQRIEGLLKDLGHPERGLRVLVVAGTNGKGSTTRVLAHLLEAAGLATATYTSPPLLAVHERIRLHDRNVDPDDFARRVRAIRPLVLKHDASWFEALTAVMVQIARDAGVDVVCCEAGLGGRLDASNALPAEAVLLTTVGLDHQHILGETRPQILAEKLGLLKRGVPLYCGVDAELRGQVFTTAVGAGAPVLFLDELARWEDGPGPWDLVLRERVLAGLPDPGTPVLRRNVALALLALGDLEARGHGPLLPADPASALGNLFLPGRYQRVLTAPDWIFDTAHNPQALAAALGAFVARPVAGRRVLVYGAMQDKPADPALAPLVGACDRVIGLPVSLPRSCTPAELEARLRGWSLAPEPWPPAAGARATVGPTAAAALAEAARGLEPGDAVLVTGSCFSVAEALWLLGVRDLDETRTARPAGPALAALVAGAAG
ncbi:MAG: folylpolyglutamate synthase/dihydrofolate synthase family protein [Candidatus Krumholzibacteriia bacterium]